MNILFICHKMPYPPNDGGAIASLSMIEGFANTGDTVHVLSMQTYKHNFDIKNLPKNLSKNVIWYQQWINTRINPIKLIGNLLFSNKPYNAERFVTKKFDNLIIRILKNESFDIIQFEGLYVTSYIEIIRKHSRAKLVLRAHNVEHEIWNRMSDTATGILKKWYYSVLAKRVMIMELNALKKVDMLVPISIRDAEKLAFKDKDQFFVCPAGISSQKIEVHKPISKQSVFYIGALDWIPNQEGLLWFLEHVWKSIHREFPAWQFVVAGRNAPDTFIKQLSNYSIEFKGEVPNALEFIDTYNLMVVPLWAGSGMRIKIIEGMARAKCIVTTSIGAEGIDAVNGRDLFIADSANDFIKVLEELLINPKQIIEIGKNACSFVQSGYDNKSLIEQLRNFYLLKLN